MEQYRRKNARKEKKETEKIGDKRLNQGQKDQFDYLNQM